MGQRGGRLGNPCPLRDGHREDSGKYAISLRSKIALIPALMKRHWVRAGSCCSDVLPIASAPGKGGNRVTQESWLSFFEAQQSAKESDHGSGLGVHFNSAPPARLDVSK